MKDRAFREALESYAERNGVSPIVLDDEAYDRSVVGITSDGRLVYDYWKMVEELEENDDCTHEEAIEWVDFNTMRAIPYMGKNAPIVIECGRELLMDMYGSGTEEA